MVSDVIRCWRILAGLAWNQPEVDSVVHALALPWSYEMSRGHAWNFSFTLYELVRGWIVARWRNLRRMKLGRRCRQSKRLDVLMVPVFGDNYYTAPCICAATAIQQHDSTVSVGLMEPYHLAGPNFEERARARGFGGVILKWHWEIPAFPLKPLFHCVKRMIRLSTLKHPPESRQFFRSNRFRRFLEILSAELVIAHFRRQLRAWGVKDLITMNEQHFPSNLLVAAANSIGIRTHQILHGGLAWQLYVPFACRFLWPEYEITARNLERFGCHPSRLCVAPGLQVASQLNYGQACGAIKHRKRESRRLLLLAQWSDFLNRWEPGKNALVVTTQALARHKGSWDLVVRPHPRDSADDLLDMQSIIDQAGIDGVVADARMDLAVEASNADLVVSASSTGIFTAIGVGTPACLIWPSELDEEFGDPPLPKEWIARTAEELLHLLDRVDNGGNEQLSCWAREQAAALGLSNLEDAPTRFAKAFFETVHGNSEVLDSLAEARRSKAVGPD